MAIKHPPRENILKWLEAAALGVERLSIATEIATLYDLANLDDPPVRTATVVGTLYREYRTQGRTDAEAMRLIELTLKLGLIERADVMEKLKARMADSIKTVLDEQKLEELLKRDTEGPR